jgi:leucyl aminopeptidase
MHITIAHESLFDIAEPLTVLCACQNEPLPPGIDALLEQDDFQGKAGQTLLVYPRGALPARRLLLVGMGERAALSAEHIRQAGARAAHKAHELQLGGFAIGLPHYDDLSAAEVARVLTEGIELGLYRYLEHKSSLSSDEQHHLEHVAVAVTDAHDATLQGVQTGQSVAQGVIRARNLANAPGNILTPARMAEVAQEIGARSQMQVTVFGPDELEQQGFGGVLAVGKGSTQTPRFIIMEHGTPTADQPTICLVGKGITFDTGGISLKPGADMDKMKMDMGGAAAVLGAMQVVGDLRLPLHVVALVSAAENMPGGNAFKPGDVIRTLSGKTVEVLNTDAEGRIVLADALWYAQRYQPHAVIDIATLTGAMSIALGPHAVGVMGNNQELIDRLSRSGERTDERVWQLPLWDEYREMVKSEIADVRNTGGSRKAGSITAAAFLDVFVGDYAWAHLDIAGTAWSEGSAKPYQGHGATGIGVRLLVQTLMDWLQ